MRPTLTRLTLLAVLALAGLSNPVLAQNAYPTQDILSTGKSIVGEDIAYPASGPAHITASIVTIAPGQETILHKHGAPLFAYLLEGDLTVDYGEKGKRAYKPGDAFMEAMAVTHRGMNTGTTLVKILAVYLGAEGTRNVIVEK